MNSCTPTHKYYIVFLLNATNGKNHDAVIDFPRFIKKNTHRYINQKLDNLKNNHNNFHIFLCCILKKENLGKVENPLFENFSTFLIILYECISWNLSHKFFSFFSSQHQHKYIYQILTFSFNATKKQFSFVYLWVLFQFHRNFCCWLFSPSFIPVVVVYIIFFYVF